MRAVTAREVNGFLRELAGVKISLKDFRTLLASAAVLETLARQTPAASARQRRRQVLEAVRAVAEELDNTPAVCRRSYIHATVVTAFEDGVLESFADVLKNNRSAIRREQLLARVVAIASEPD
jgi:DNA topoisomerase-1